MLRELLFKIKSFWNGKKQTEEEKHVKNVLELLKQEKGIAKNAEAVLHLFDLAMHDKALELDEKRKQTYIQ
jgi:truncated hemoglobin YjbI